MDKVLLLFGGNSNEHEISCKSVINVIDHIDNSLFNFKIVGITKDGKWIKCNKDNIMNKKWYKHRPISNIANYLKKFDVVFPVMHGVNVEDGKLQGMLDSLNVKYVGSKPDTSMIGMNKNLFKIIMEKYSIKQLPFRKYTNDIKDFKDLKFPVIVKPCNGGSSIGITKANNIKELKDAIDKAQKYDSNIIVEKFITAKEYECAILENNDQKLINIGEIRFNHEFYDYDDKYNNEVKLIIPANISDDLKAQIQNISLMVFDILNCKDLCRIDFLYDEEEDNLYLNEINTLPGFTDKSMFPMLIENLGYTYTDIITILIKNAKHGA